MHFFSFCLLCCIGLLLPVQGSILKITSEYQQAKTIAKVYEKPLLLVFLGGAYLEESSTLLLKIKQKEFEKELNGELGVFLTDLNFSLLIKEELKNYQELIDRYKVESFPSLILVDQNFDEISRLESSGLSSKELAVELKKSVFDYRWILSMLENNHQQSIEDLYKKAASLGCQFLKNKILDKAFESEIITSDLKIERYLSMLRGGIESSVILDFRNKYLIEECVKAPEVLDRISWIDFQFSVPLLDLEKSHLEKNKICLIQ
jgi:hypothetical protein